MTELEVCTLVMFFTGTNEAITGNTKLTLATKAGTFKSEKKLWPIFVGKEWLQTEIDNTEIKFKAKVDIFHTCMLIKKFQSGLHT